jgi:pimeloyl-ACP methyl ester carboxylesterase
MSGNSPQPQRDVVRVGELELQIVRGGQGNPLLVLHEELGYPGWLNWMDDLSRERTLIVPLHPGFGQTPRLDWMGSMRDLAAFYVRFLEEQGLVPIDVLGFSLGGWLAAEMAVSYPRLFRRSVLVAPLGIRPPEGEIFEMFGVFPKVILEASVRDPAATPEFDSLFTEQERPAQFEAWEDARTQLALLAWQPYLHSTSLPHLLQGVDGGNTLLIWGSDDRIVPASAAGIYQKSLRGSRVEILSQCGHRPEIEQREAFVTTVRDFLDG